tara:strand:- start:84 stop:245 length:162 start_codon:yes stop_codon:yes gene_type:complete
MKLLRNVLLEMQRKYDLKPEASVVNLHRVLTLEDYDKLAGAMKYPNGMVRRAL